MLLHLPKPKNTKKSFFIIITNKTGQERMKQYTLSDMEDRYIGKIGTPARDEYEYKLRMELLARMKADVHFNVKLENRPVQLF